MTVLSLVLATSFVALEINLCLVLYDGHSKHQSGYIVNCIVKINILICVILLLLLRDVHSGKMPQFEQW